MHFIDSKCESLDQRVIAVIQALPKIDAVWAALENNLAKKIRKYLREKQGLLGSNNRVKGYWGKR